MPSSSSSSVTMSSYDITTPKSNAQQSLLELAASELELIRNADQTGIIRPITNSSSNPYNDTGSTKNNATTTRNEISRSPPSALFHASNNKNQSSSSFPPACLKFLQSLPGNKRCIDCGQLDPQWASATYGVLLCLRCSGRHRGLGVQFSFVRSISMDSWSHIQILSMLEGGNKQLSQFFERHSLGPSPKSQQQPRSNSYPSYTRSNSAPMIDDIVDKRYITKAAQFYREQLAVHVQRVAKDGEYKGREVARRQSKGVKATNTNNRRSLESSSKQGRKKEKLLNGNTNENENVKQASLGRYSSLSSSLSSPERRRFEAAAAAS
mmetsp:Transcript_24900/g.33008  ORF Transcript_24900/g.33008 Transcript_24900/m.33008 type:complete len:323 (-) Transcript_24900:150-1118(-)